MHPETGEVTWGGSTRKAGDCLKGKVMAIPAASGRRHSSQTSWGAVTDEEVLHYLGWNHFPSSGEAQRLCESYPEAHRPEPSTVCCCITVWPARLLLQQGRELVMPSKRSAIPSPTSLILLRKFLLNKVCLPLSIRESLGIAGLLWGTAPSLILPLRGGDMRLSACAIFVFCSDAKPTFQVYSQE